MKAKIVGTIPQHLINARLKLDKDRARSRLLRIKREKANPFKKLKSYTSR